MRLRDLTSEGYLVYTFTKPNMLMLLIQLVSIVKITNRILIIIKVYLAYYYLDLQSTPKNGPDTHSAGIRSVVLGTFFSFFLGLDV